MSFDQVTLIKNLNLIIKEHGEGHFEKLSDSGVCAGLIVMYKDFKCPRHVESNHDFFTRINEINQLNKDDIKNLKKEVRQKYLLFSCEIKDRHVSTLTVYSDYGKKLQSLGFGIASPMALIVKDKETLIPELQSIASEFSEFFIDFSSINHIVSLHFKDNRFSFYDPNYGEGELTDLSVERAAKEVFAAFDCLKPQYQYNASNLMLIVKLIPVLSPSLSISYNDETNRFVDSLLKHQGDQAYDLNTQDVLGSTLLFEAVELENQAAAKYLIDNNVIHHPLYSQLSPIHQCIINGNLPILNLLLNKYKEDAIKLRFNGVNLQIYALNSAKNMDILNKVWELPIEIDHTHFYETLLLCREKISKREANTNIFESILYSSLSHGSNIVGPGTAQILPLLHKLLPNLLGRIEAVFKYFEDNDIVGIDNTTINHLTTLNYLLDEGSGLHRLVQTMPNFCLEEERCLRLLSTENYSDIISDMKLDGISRFLAKNKPNII